LSKNFDKKPKKSHDEKPHFFPTTRPQLPSEIAYVFRIAVFIALEEEENKFCHLRGVQQQDQKIKKDGLWVQRH